MRKKLLDKLKNPDELLLKSLRTLTNITGIPGIDFNFYSKLRSKAKESSEIAFIGEKKIEDVKNQLFIYNEQTHEEVSELTEFKPYDSLEGGNVYWLNFHGIHDVPLIQKLGKALQIDRLTISQVVDTTQRPKIDDYEHYLFFSVKSVEKSEDNVLNVEQVSFILGAHFVVSFQEEVGDHFGHIRSKIRNNLGPIRRRGSDYLLAQLLDAILDNYFETIDVINHALGALEKETLTNPSRETLLLIEKMKKSAEIIKKSLIPFKEALINILKDRTDYIKKNTRKYFRDIKNSCTNAIEEIDATYKSLESLTNIYFASLSQKMNETMKVLTTVATIFIPLTFIAGIYGMNFEYMPELHYRNGYLVIWLVMISVFGGMLVYFKKKKWL